MTADDGSVDGLTETGFSGGSDDGSGTAAYTTRAARTKTRPTWRR